MTDKAIENKVKAILSVTNPEKITPQFIAKKIFELFGKERTGVYWLVTLEGEQDTGLLLKILEVPKIKVNFNFLSGRKWLGFSIDKTVYRKGNVFASVGIGMVRPYDLSLQIQYGWKPAIVANIRF